MITAEDRAELSDLVHRYASCADRRELGELAHLFTEDAVLAVPDPPRTMRPTHEARGRAAIIETCRTLERTHATLHAIVGNVFDMAAAPDTATGDVACIAHHLTGKPGNAVDVVWHLRYRDRYRRVDGRWLIARRVLHLGWTERRPVLALGDLDS
ncbi:nuclear transport factor 2 family protein [Nocardia cyriacigeorgica]|uniref:nuclear transport factor 2 family protein n=1 Tax=Nocardia cyriacigeorgica TaxID=135487 RepID=UPI0013D36A76|nr:nuclear transport factor 2 family protein [Nocardia cyriacigeorgica]MBF6435277.1 nuclear transport factor 2 family protein [Nocardia cyriacigeorgica]NEW27163.1 nuclear transport factor 2 family protein [Nocardia cyriacigeorgica]